jgi:hypothetical protein
MNKWFYARPEMYVKGGGRGKKHDDCVAKERTIDPDHVFESKQEGKG